MKCKYEHDWDCCYACADQYMCKCNQPCEFLNPLTNADRIRSMTDEELAEIIMGTINCDGYECGKCPFCGPVGKILDWLQQPCGGADQ